MRLAIVVVAMMLCATARAQDDEGVLDTPPIEGLPERMEALEHEWHEEVGTKEPVDKADAPDEQEKEEKEGALPAPGGLLDVEEDEPPARHDDVPDAAKAAPPPRTRVFPAPIEKPKDEAPTAGAKVPVPEPTPPAD